MCIVPRESGYKLQGDVKYVNGMFSVIQPMYVSYVFRVNM